MIKPAYISLLVLIIFAQLSISSDISKAVTNTLSPDQVRKTAQSVTSKITLNNGTEPISGSGVIIQKQGNNYTLVTNAHVVCLNYQLGDCDKASDYDITTPDQQLHKVKNTAVKILPNLDLAIIQFQSDKNYPTAIMGDSDTIKIDEPVYAAGFPVTANAFSFNHGTIIANVKNRITGDKGGYTTIYDASTNKGMSGGGIFNQKGQVIAIHGKGDRYTENTISNNLSGQQLGSQEIQDDLGLSSNPDTNNYFRQKTGINRGIPIKYLIDKIFPSETKFNKKKLSFNTSTPVTADEWFVMGLNKAIDPDIGHLNQDRMESIQAYNQAIKLNSSYFMAYYIRGRLLEQLNLKEKALKDYQAASNLQAISVLKYIARSDSKLRVGYLSGNIFNFDSALDDINKAIQIDPDYALAYTVRASLFFGKQDFSKAITDLDKVIKIDPFYDTYFLMRAFAKSAKSDTQGAIEDLNQAIKIKESNAENTDSYRLYLSLLVKKQTGQEVNLEDIYSSNSVSLYLARANRKASQGDLQGALAEYNQAIEVKPSAWAFAYRAIFKGTKLQDIQGAEVDFYRAIEIRPNDPMLYYFRGGLRISKDKKGAISDFQKSAQIYKKRGDEQKYLQMMNLISVISSN
jgi:tetratricopeptide (TPR) repeat protein